MVKLAKGRRLVEMKGKRGWAPRPRCELVEARSRSGIAMPIYAPWCSALRRNFVPSKVRDGRESHNYFGARGGPATPLRLPRAASQC